MSKTNEEVMREILQRVTRTETRVMSLGSKLGYDLKDEEDIEVDKSAGIVTIKTLDVAYTSVIKAARRAGLHGKRVYVMFDGESIAEVLV